MRRTHALSKRLPTRAIASKTTNSIPAMAMTVETAKGEYHGVDAGRTSQASQKVDAATANGTPTFMRAAPRSIEISVQRSHLYSTVILGCRLESIVREQAL